MDLMVCAVTDLQISKQEFFDLAPVEFDAMMKRHVELRKYDIQKADYRAGLLASIICNAMAKKDTAPALPFDFFPEHQKETYQERKQKNIFKRAEADKVIKEMFANAQEKKSNG